MKILRMKNEKGIERLYIQFICYPRIYQESICYFVSGRYYDSEYMRDKEDVMECYENPDNAMKECFRLCKLLNEQPELDSDTYWELVRSLEDDQNDNDSK